jgi:hypothetical protein
MKAKQNKDLQRTALETVYSRRYSRRERKIELEKDVMILFSLLSFYLNSHKKKKRAQSYDWIEHGFWH